MRGLSPSPTPRSASSLSSGTSADDRPSARARSTRGGPAPEIRAQRAVVAVRYGAAVRLADSHEQRVKLVEQAGIGRQVCLEPRAGLFVTRRWADQTVASENAPRIGVGDEHWPTHGIEEDCIGCLRTESGDLEQAPAQRAERR